MVGRRRSGGGGGGGQGSGCRVAARGGLQVTEAPRSADPAARRGAMEIGTEISRKIRVRPASAGGEQASGRLPGVTGRVGLPRLLSAGRL